MTQPKVLTTEEVAVKLGRSTRYVQRLAKTVLPVYGKTETGGFMFKVSDVNRLS